MVDKAEQGGFNISGSGCFRAIQRLKKYEHVFLFSKLSITKAAKDLEGAASEIIPWKIIKEENEGEQVEYTDKEKMLVGTIRSYGLE